MKTCTVVDAADHTPIEGAKVWVQPWAPIHPFWPAGAKGVTNAAGETELSLPDGFWFEWSGASAPGYRQVRDPAKYEERIHKAYVFYLQRSPADGSR